MPESEFDARNASRDNAITPDFINAVRVYRSADDVELSLEDQFRVIADRISEDQGSGVLSEIDENYAMQERMEALADPLYGERMDSADMGEN